MGQPRGPHRATTSHQVTAGRVKGFSVIRSRFRTLVLAPYPWLASPRVPTHILPNGVESIVGGCEEAWRDYAVLASASCWVTRRAVSRHDRSRTTTSLPSWPYVRASSGCAKNQRSDSARATGSPGLTTNPQPADRTNSPTSSTSLTITGIPHARYSNTLIGEALRTGRNGATQTFAAQM